MREILTTSCRQIISWAQDVNETRKQVRDEIRKQVPGLCPLIDKGIEIEAIMLKSIAANIPEVRDAFQDLAMTCLAMLDLPTNLRRTYKYGVKPLFTRQSQRNITNFFCLPSEVQLHVFSYLDIKSLKRCQKVCKQWNILINQFQFDKSSRLYLIWQSHQTATSLFHLLPNLDNLEKLQFKKNSIILKSVAREIINMSIILLLPRILGKVFSVQERSMFPDIVDCLYVALFARFHIQAVSRRASNELLAFKDLIHTDIKNISLPSELLEDPILKQYKCPLSKKLMLLPVEDESNRVCDYLSIVEEAFNLRNPPRHQLKFRIDIFMIIRDRIRQLIEMDHRLIQTLKKKPIKLIM